MDDRFSYPFQPGDVVELRSGSPPLTVVKMETSRDGTLQALCIWFVQGEKRMDWIIAVALQRASPS